MYIFFNVFLLWFIMTCSYSLLKVIVVMVMYLRENFRLRDHNN